MRILVYTFPRVSINILISISIFLQHKFGAFGTSRDVHPHSLVVVPPTPVIDATTNADTVQVSQDENVKKRLAFELPPPSNSSSHFGDNMAMAEAEADNSPHTTLNNHMKVKSEAVVECNSLTDGKHDPQKFNEIFDRCMGGNFATLVHQVPLSTTPKSQPLVTTQSDNHLTDNSISIPFDTQLSPSISAAVVTSPTNSMRKSTDDLKHVQHSDLSAPCIGIDKEIRRPQILELNGRTMDVVPIRVVERPSIYPAITDPGPIVTLSPSQSPKPDKSLKFIENLGQDGVDQIVPPQNLALASESFRDGEYEIQHMITRRPSAQDLRKDLDTQMHESYAHLGNISVAPGVSHVKSVRRVQFADEHTDPNGSFKASSKSELVSSLNDDETSQCNMPSRISEAVGSGARTGTAWGVIGSPPISRRGAKSRSFYSYLLLSLPPHPTDTYTHISSLLSLVNLY